MLSNNTRDQILFYELERWYKNDGCDVDNSSSIIQTKNIDSEQNLVSKIVIE